MGRVDIHKVMVKGRRDMINEWDGMMLRYEGGILVWCVVHMNECLGGEVSLLLFCYLFFFGR